MNFMVNLMREHVPQETRLHYVITSGGSAPNVIPDFAEVYYYVRHPDPEQVREIFDRVAEASRGAALGTGTTVEHEVIGGSYSRLPVVATDVGGSAEVVSAPELGTVVPFGDHDALLAALDGALQRQWHAGTIVSYAGDNHWDRRIDVIRREYESLLSD